MHMFGDYFLGIHYYFLCIIDQENTFTYMHLQIHTLYKGVCYNTGKKIKACCDKIKAINDFWRIRKRTSGSNPYIINYIGCVCILS